MQPSPWSCGTAAHLTRRSVLKAAGWSGLAWLTPVAEILAGESLPERRGRPAKSIILLWLSGGPSQLETFDPHAGKAIAGDTAAIATRAKGIQLAAALPRLADQMDDVSIIRNVVTREGDHERAAYNVKTGYRPDPTIVHPSLGAIACHQLDQGTTEIPRHISILPDRWFGRGGFLGQRFDAFRAFSSSGDLPDMEPRVTDDRFQARLKDLEVVEGVFRDGRVAGLDDAKTLHGSTVTSAVTMMTSEQRHAFSIDEEPAALRRSFGDSDFGRACLAAIRLIEVGVRCVEVTLGGWDSHINNHEIQHRLAGLLDPAFAGLVQELKRRDRLQDTLVICAGEFGRTPSINPAGGRDHWPHGFSIAVAGGTLRGGQVIGETDPEGGPLTPEQGTTIGDVHATLLAGLGIPPNRELQTPVGRPMKLSDGQPLRQLLS